MFPLPSRRRPRRHRPTSETRMKIAALQMVSAPSVERNLEAARRLIAEAAAAGARLVALPEYFCFRGRPDRDRGGGGGGPGPGPTQRALAEAARTHRVWV